MAKPLDKSVASEVPSLYRMLPSLNALLLEPEFAEMLQTWPRASVVRATRAALNALKSEIDAGTENADDLSLKLRSIKDLVQARLEEEGRYSLRPVINATGVLLHTNLGRAPLSQSAIDNIAEVARGYCNLELDLESGNRSRRDQHAESLILRLLAVKLGFEPEKAQAVVVVNNCAAATFLALNSLAERGEAIVSRGELVEIGGGFRIPDILAKSGAILREVGTTNRTKVSDYASAVSSETALIVRVHQSNFSIEGFTERPSLAELAALAKETGIPLFEDQGTGLINDLSDFEVRDGSSLLESVLGGCDLVAASGDKLLGGPQCGILIGRQDLIERIRKNPLLRTFRVDKLTYAALEATLLDHLSGDADSIPTFRMMRESLESIERRCRWVVSKLEGSGLVSDVAPATSVIGGGTTPRATLESFAIRLRHPDFPAQALISKLRELKPPIIARVEDDRVLLDLRTVNPELDATLAEQLKTSFAGSQ
jgi:L-seryl-tRNA(Ser) seleniumtransferase